MDYFFPLVFICLFIWQQVIKRYLKISRNLPVTHVQDRNPKKKKKNTALRWKKRNGKYFIATK